MAYRRQKHTRSSEGMLWLFNVTTKRPFRMQRLGQDAFPRALFHPYLVFVPPVVCALQTIRYSFWKDITANNHAKHSKHIGSEFWDWAILGVIFVGSSDTAFVSPCPLLRPSGMRQVQAFWRHQPCRGFKLIRSLSQNVTKYNKHMQKHTGTLVGAPCIPIPHREEYSDILWYNLFSCFVLHMSGRPCNKAQFLIVS